MLNYYLKPKKERDFWSDFFAPVTFQNSLGSMKTDVTENDKEYLFDVELPGYKKEDVRISLDDGYLTVEATQKKENNEENENRYIRRERYMGTVSRSWYVGNVDKQQIKAAFNNGILNISVPKEELPLEEQKNYITIE